MWPVRPATQSKGLSVWSVWGRHVWLYMWSGSGQLRLVASATAQRGAPVGIAKARCLAMAGMQRVDRTAIIAPVEACLANPGSWGPKLPKIIERLTVKAYSDGTRRSPGRLGLEEKNGFWYASITEPDSDVWIVAEASTPDEAFPALEGLLALPNPPWTMLPWKKPKPPRKGKN